MLARSVPLGLLVLAFLNISATGLDVELSKKDPREVSAGDGGHDGKRLIGENVVPDEELRKAVLQISGRDIAPSENDGSEKGPVDDNDPRLVKTRALRGILSDLEDSALHLPRLFDDVMGSALSSLDRAAEGLLSGFTDTTVDYATSADKSKLIVRLHMPKPREDDNERAAPRILQAAVLGQSHLRTTITTQAEGFTSESVHTFPLPVRVAKDGLEISTKPDGTVHLSLQILEEGEGESEHESVRDEGVGKDSMDRGFLRLPFRTSLFPSLLGGEELADGNETEAMLQVPSADGVDKCREQFSNDRMSLDKCLCDATIDEGSRAVCYGKFISKAVSMARKLDLNEDATNAKHIAIECTSGRENKAKCLEKVARDLIETMYHRKGAPADLNDRIRQALESEDDGPSEFQPSIGFVFIKLVIVSILLMAVFWACVLVTSRRRIFTNGATNAIQQLSSVLAQTSSSPERSRSSSTNNNARFSRNLAGSKDMSENRGSKLA